MSPVFSPVEVPAVEIVRQGLEQQGPATMTMCDRPSAGRLQIDENMGRGLHVKALAGAK